MECLNNVIGITRTGCNCFTEDFNEAAAISQSGLYIDELPEFPLKLSTLKSGNGLCESLQSKMENARTRAIQFFKEELFKQLALKYSQTVKPYNGLIGNYQWQNSNPVSQSFAGIYLHAKQMGGAVMTLTQIDTFFVQAASFNILVYGNDILLDTIPVVSNANNKAINILPTALEYPLTDVSGNPYEYKFVYSTSGLTPKDTKMSCGCGGKEFELDKFFTKSGISFNNINQVSKSAFSYGINLKVTIRCGTDDIICDAYENNEFVRQVIPASIQRKAVEFLIIDLLASRVIDRDTMINRDVMSVNGVKLHNKFKNDVQWVAENINLNGNGCFSCNPTQKTVSFGGIRL